VLAEAGEPSCSVSPRIVLLSYGRSEVTDPRIAGKWYQIDIKNRVLLSPATIWVEECRLA
jgi:hypothetical protein